MTSKHASDKTSTSTSGYVGKHQADAERPSRVVIETVQGHQIGRPASGDNYTER